MKSFETDHSRGLLLAEGVTRAPKGSLEHQLEDSLVAVTVDPHVPQAILTARVLLTTLRRGPGQLVLDRHGLRARDVETIEREVWAIDPQRPLRVERHSTRKSTVRLHIGATGPNGAIRLMPEGCGAHVAGARSARINPSRPGNPLGAVFTAALGAAEAFKHCASVVPDRRVLHRHLRFCPVSLSSDLAAAPQLSSPVHLSLALVGVGAIGTGIALILGELGAQGHVLAVDPQHFEPENLGTYSLGGHQDVVSSVLKVDLARRALPEVDVQVFAERVEKLPDAIDAGRVPWPRIILAALDSPESRRQTQRIWPDRLIDAATGETMLGLRDYAHQVGPCMYCVFPPGRDGSGVEGVAEHLGLPAELLAQGEEILKAEHLETLDGRKREALLPYVGKPICGLAHAAGLTDLDAQGFMPSVPFVSLQAACLAVGRLIGSQAEMSHQPNLVQYDGLCDPRAATLEHMKPRTDCYCQSRGDVVSAVRARRADS